MAYGHCLAPWGNAGLLVGGSLPSYQQPVPGIPGLGFFTPASSPKGTVVYLHGIYGAPESSPLAPAVWNGTSSFVAESTLIADLLADNWSVLFPAHPEDGVASGAPALAFYNNIVSDALPGGPGGITGKGWGLTRTWQLWADHLVQYCLQQTPGKPIGLVGFSEGAWAVAQLLTYMTIGSGAGQVVGAVIINPATLFQNVDPLFGAPWYNLVSPTGVNLTSTFLSGIGSTPVLLGYGTADNAVGYGGVTTVAAASSGANVTSWTSGSPGSLTVANASQVVAPGASLTIDTSAGAGNCVAEVTGTVTGNVISGLITMQGSGTLSTGGNVVQSLTQQIIASAGVGLTSQANDYTGHGFDPTDAATFTTFVNAL